MNEQEDVQQAADHVFHRRYLSTACFHGLHEYCNSTVGETGPKIPGKCKFCDAKCVCVVCHD